MSQQIVILAAGKGTRMGSGFPKVLLPLDVNIDPMVSKNYRSIISNLLDEVKEVPQIPPPIIVVGFQEQLVKDALGPNYNYVTQFDQKGTAHAVLSAKQAVTADNFIVLNGDMPFTKKESLQKLIQLHNDNHAMVSMFTVELPNFENHNEHFLSWGRIIRDENGGIIKIQEYKDSSDEQKLITEVNTGTYMFNSEWLWDKLKKIGHDNAQHEFYLTDIIELAIADAQKIYSLKITPQESYGINNPDDLDFARKIITE